MIELNYDMDTFIQLTKKDKFNIIIDNEGVRIAKYDEKEKCYPSKDSYRINWGDLHEILSYSPKAEQ